MNLRKHDVPDELLSRLLANYQKPEVLALVSDRPSCSISIDHLH